MTDDELLKFVEVGRKVKLLDLSMRMCLRTVDLRHVGASGFEPRSDGATEAVFARCDDDALRLTVVMTRQRAS